jgi:acyl-coenzyme A synthetase/AMP-(fatty) acid ligase
MTLRAPEPVPPRFNMAAYCIGRAAATRPQAPALLVIDDPGARTPAEVWTFAEIEEASLRIAAALHAAGLGPARAS